MTHPLLDYARARTTDPRTAHAAAAGTNVPRSHRLVLEALGSGTATAGELVSALRGACSASRVRGALAELVKAGEVIELDAGARTELGNECLSYRRRP